MPYKVHSYYKCIQDLPGNTTHANMKKAFNERKQAIMLVIHTISSNIALLATCSYGPSTYDHGTYPELETAQI